MTFDRVTTDQGGRPHIEQVRLCQSRPRLHSHHPATMRDSSQRRGCDRAASSGSRAHLSLLPAVCARCLFCQHLPNISLSTVFGENVLIAGLGMLLGTMQDDGLACKPRATDFSIAAIMAKEPPRATIVRQQPLVGEYYLTEVTSGQLYSRCWSISENIQPKRINALSRLQANETDLFLPLLTFS